MTDEKKFYEELKLKIRKRTFYEVLRVTKLEKLPAGFDGLFIIVSSLRRWINLQRPIMRIYWRWFYSSRRIGKRLDPQEIDSLVETIYVLEGVDVEALKKKAKKERLSPKQM